MVQGSSFRSQETHGIVWRPDVRVHASSERLGWSSVFVSAQFEAPFQASVISIPDHLLVLHVGGPARVGCTSGSAKAECLVPPGGIVLHPGGLGFDIRLDAAIETVHVSLRRAIVDLAAADLGASASQFELVRRTGVTDALLEQLSLALRAAISTPEPNTTLYADHLSMAMAAHLVRSHSTAFLCRDPVRTQGGLTPGKLDRAISHIRGFLDRPLSAEEISAEVGLSTLHFSRCFKASTGLPLHRYVLRERVNLAKRLLISNRMSIAEIAIACGFAHQEHLTRVFRTWCGTTPAVFRRSARV